MSNRKQRRAAAKVRAKIRAKNPEATEAVKLAVAGINEAEAVLQRRDRQRNVAAAAVAAVEGLVQENGGPEALQNAEPDSDLADLAELYHEAHEVLVTARQRFVEACVDVVEAYAELDKPGPMLVAPTFGETLAVNQGAVS